MSESYEPLLDATVQYGYFLMQARACRRPGGVVLTGVLENLGTGEKTSFESSDALSGLLEAWGRVTQDGRMEAL